MTISEQCTCNAVGLCSTDMTTVSVIYTTIIEITEIQALGQASGKGPKTQTVVLPNNVRIEADDVRIAYSQLTIGRALGNGKPH